MGVLCAADTPSAKQTEGMFPGTFPGRKTQGAFPKKE